MPEAIPRPLPSASFLSSLRPPPLPLWAIPHASTALSLTSLSLSLAYTSTSLGFRIATTSTKFGFSCAKFVAGPVLSGVGSIIDHALGTDGGGIGSGVIVNSLHGALAGAELLALGGIGLGREITQATLGSLSATVTSLDLIYGNSEAVRALSAFLLLVKSEYSTSLPTDPYETGGLSRWNWVQVTKAAATWAALQSVTGAVLGERLVGEMEELDLESWGKTNETKRAGEEAEESGEGSELIWEVTDEMIMDTGEEVIEASLTSKREAVSSPMETARSLKEATQLEQDIVTRNHLKRFSKLCLGSYGGIGMVFFGVKLPASSIPSNSPSSTPDALATDRRVEENDIGIALTGGRISQEEDEEEKDISAALGSSSIPLNTSSLSGESTPEIVEVVPSLPSAPAPSGSYNLWGLLSGSHDLNVLESLGDIAPGSALQDTHAAAEDSSDDEMGDEKTPAESRRIHQAKIVRKKEKEARIRQEAKGRRPPRFFVITDHPNQSILLCLRGTLSIDDVATDLACEAADFDETLFWDEDQVSSASGYSSSTSSSNKTTTSSSSGMRTPGSLSSEKWTTIDSDSGPADPEEERKKPRGHTYTVHGGMWEVALAMGGREGAVTRAVARALRKNPTYDLFLIGHSLGAGIASLLGIMWTNPETCLTSSKSGLPAGRKVKVYGFAPPCTTDQELSLKCKKLICSFVYSSDAVSRFSLGHIRDIRSAAAWLCYANENPEESCDNILSRITAYKAGRLDDDVEAKMEEEAWFTALRTTLEANMNYSTLFPPGDVYWLVRPDDLILPEDVLGEERAEHRFFRISGRVDVVYKQMLFTQKMLSSHLPHQFVPSEM